MLISLRDVAIELQGRIYLAQGRYREALSSFRQAEQLGGYSATRRHAAALAATKDYATARKVMAALSASSKAVTDRFEQISIPLDQGKLVEAADAAKAAVIASANAEPVLKYPFQVAQQTVAFVVDPRTVDRAALGRIASESLTQAVIGDAGDRDDLVIVAMAAIRLAQRVGDRNVCATHLPQLEALVSQSEFPPMIKTLSLIKAEQLVMSGRYLHSWHKKKGFMRLRRCAVLFIEARESVAFDLGILLRGGAGLSRRSVWVALAPHLDHEVEIDHADMQALGAISPTEWIEQAQLVGRDAESIRRLLEWGLLISDDESSASFRRSDDALRACHWWPAAAVAHWLSRWQGVDGVMAMESSGMISANDLRKKLGPPPRLKSGQQGMKAIEFRSPSLMMMSSRRCLRVASLAGTTIGQDRFPMRSSSGCCNVY